MANMFVGAFCALCLQAAYGEIVFVAVASNFSETAHVLAKRFNERSGHVVRISSGSSGKLYAQIRNGAPFDIFLSADTARPERVEFDGLAVPGTRFSYAEGTLVLWSVRERYADRNCLEVLKSLDFDYLAIANPDTAPYGAAAKQWLEGLGLWRKIRSRIVTGENIGQAFHFAATRNAALGLVAAAQLADTDIPAGSCRYAVPASDHAPIMQQGVLLRRARGSAAAREFIASLHSDAATEEILRRGYRRP
ncbi:MAG: molybdate ABC transporter substrate-binding protein [Gammaproteobacteria bacterium]|nr:molybdate ABC transporter substrate-binding protein [Gammaproteobacteria bacterium]